MQLLYVHSEINTLFSNFVFQKESCTSKFNEPCTTLQVKCIPSLLEVSTSPGCIGSNYSFILHNHIKLDTW